MEQKFGRALCGLDPKAVRANLASLEWFYLRQAEGDSAVVPGLRRMRGRLFGYRRDEVWEALAEVRRMGEARLAQRSKMQEGLPVGQEEERPVPAGQDEPRPVPAGQEEPRLGPAGHDEPRLVPGFEMASEMTPAEPLRLQGWRPGAVEDEEPPAATEPAVKPETYRLGRAAGLPAAPQAAARAPGGVTGPPGAGPGAAAEPGPLAGPGAGPAAGPEAAEAPPRPERAEAQIHRGVSDRLEQLFTRFLQGKLTGRDLTLPGGKLLAPAGTPISRDLVALAEEAGLLPALIAHMTVPGLTDEPGR